MYRWLSFVLLSSIFGGSWAVVKESCNGQVKVFTAASGYFNTPNYGFGQYAPNDRCFWQILVNPGQRIKLEFKAFGTPLVPDCANGDRVAVYDSDQETPESLLGTFCGTNIPAPITSRSNKLFVKFVSDRDNEGAGFYCLYSAINDRPQTIPPANAGFRLGVTPSGANDVAPPMERVGPKCNGKVSVLTAPSGIIQSPNYGIGSYFPDDTCYWQIIAIPGKIIRLQLIVMSLEEGTGCHNDYTTIYDGATESAPLLQAYCGRKSVPSELLTTGSAMFVKFRSDPKNQRDGFRFLYSLVDRPSSPTPPPKPPTTPVPKDKCSGRHQIFTSKSGFIISPNFGYGEYYANDVCFWQILAPDAHKVKLSFQTFEVEDGFACPKDELVIYDGPSEMSPLIGSFCGSNKPATIISSSNGLYIKFSTDAHAQYIGFKIFYEFSEPPKKERCNGEMNTLTETSGFIFSPNYGKGDYPEDDICHWQIIGQENTRVRLKVESLVMEQSPDCTKDYLAIWDGPGENALKMKVFCGSVAQEVLLSTGSYMYLKFKANGDGNYPGFKLFYEVVEAPPKDKCNGKTEVLHDQQGYFQSPNLGNGLYYNNDLCFWDIRAPPGQHIRLIFEKFDLEDSSDCPLHDHLAIYDGQSEDSAQVADLCGHDLPKTIESSDNAMFAKFQTDAARRAAGFRIFYEFFIPAKTEPILPPAPEPCNGKEFLLTGTFGSFNSPNFGSGEYFPDDNCYWLVSSDFFNRIKLTFDSFDIEADPQCLRDRVIVYDGPTEQSPVLGTFCGYSLPNPIESTSAQLLVKFESDSSAQRTGFKASYDTEPAAPGLQDPRFMYYRGAPWAAPPVPHAPVVSMPGLKPVPMDTSVSLIRNDQLDPSGHLSTQLSASAANRPAKCNGAVTLVKATAFPMYAQSPNFGSGNYFPQDTCYWLIQSDLGTVIRVNFLSFDLENGGRNCPNDYVALYDGEGDQSPILGRFCGPNLPRTVQSHGRSMLVEFNSDQSNEKGGFKFAYESVSLQPVQTSMAIPGVPEVLAANGNETEQGWLRHVPNFGDIASAAGMHRIPGIDSQSVANVVASGSRQQHSINIPAVPPVPQPQHYQFGQSSSSEQQSAPLPSNLQQQLNQHRLNTQASFPPNPAQRFVQQFVQQQFTGPTSMPVVAGDNFGFGGQQLKQRPRNSRKEFAGSYEDQGAEEEQEQAEDDLQQQSEANDAEQQQQQQLQQAEALLALQQQLQQQQQERHQHQHQQQEFDDVGTFMSIPTGPQHEEASHAQRLNKACRGRIVSMVAPTDSTAFHVSTAKGEDGNYLASDNCNWFLSAAADKVIQIQFSSYEISASNSPSCETDFIAIYNGVNRKAPLIGRYCTRNPPPASVFTNGSYAFVEFSAAAGDSPTRGHGFSFEFKQIEPQSASVDAGRQTEANKTKPSAEKIEVAYRSPAASSSQPRCLGRQVLLTGMRGLIQPPVNDQGNYYPLDTCIWRLAVEAGKKIIFQFERLSIEETPQCQYDAVRIYDGPSTAGQQPVLLGGYCGNVIPAEPITSSSNQAEVVFSSDSTVEDKGFLVSYRVV